jgi:hypothetical protein
MTSSLRIIVTGMIAHHPMGGMTWHYLQYVLGLARLGHDVYYLEDMGAAPQTAGDKWRGNDCAFNVEYLSDVMAQFGLRDKWAYCFYHGPRWFGLPDRERLAVIRSADLLLNVSGSLARPENYGQVGRLAYIDTDAVFTQVKLALGDVSFSGKVNAHDGHFSFGERVSGAVPATGHQWHPTRQPVVLSEWQPSSPRREAFTTVMNWKVRSKPLVYDGQTYGHKDAEFIRFLDLPTRVAPIVLELALTTGKARQDPRELLTTKGWRVVDPQEVCPDFDSYRRYIEGSVSVPPATWPLAGPSSSRIPDSLLSFRSGRAFCLSRPWKKRLPQSMRSKRTIRGMRRRPAP